MNIKCNIIKGNELLVKSWCEIVNYILSSLNVFILQLSPTIMSALGKDTDGAKMIVEYVLTKIQSNLSYFKSEPILLRDTVELFCDVVCVKQKYS